MDFHSEVLDNSVNVGKIISTHGLTGELKVRIVANYDDFLELSNEIILYSEEKKRILFSSLKSYKKNSKIALVKLEGYDTIEDAKKIVDYYIRVSISNLPKLKDGEYYFFQLYGATVVDENDKIIGVIDDIIETGSADVLSVYAQEDIHKQNEVMIPCAKEFIINMDLDKKLVKVRLPVYFERDV